MLTNQRLRVVELALIAVGIGAVLVVASGITGPLRILFVAPALLLLPGAAIVSRLGIDTVATGLGLTLALSLAVSTAGMMFLLAINWYQPFLLAALLALASLGVLALDVRRLTAGHGQNVTAS